MKFIRLDAKGEWKDKDHISSMGGLGEESYFERGISCYRLDDQAQALDNLNEYWFNIANVTEDDLHDMQITIFEGELVGQGSDWEDVATCTKTLKEINAKSVMMQVNDLYWDKECSDIDEEEYEQKLNDIELI